MGVPGLWDILNKAAQPRAISHLAAVDGFERNASGRRAYRIGIDASIWYQHSLTSKSAGDTGDNPELRMLFFRLCRLAESPFVPLFVFDGRERPKIKRKSRMGKSGSHQLSQGMKELLRLFGMQWIAAKGEAEAELARLNRLGIIDAVMTDDVDALVFGAKTVIKNLNLSGNKSYPAVNKEGKQSPHHVNIYTADAVEKEIGLTTGGMILFALLAGGDYDDGVNQCGPALSHGLARAGYGDSLLQAFRRRNDQDIRPFLRQWREDVNREINTNSRGFLPRRQASFALPVDFPNLDVLNAYANPVCHSSHEHLTDRGEMSIRHLAAFCEDKFTEWGTRSMIIKRFRKLLWEAAVIRVLRRAALEADDRERCKRRAAGNEDRSIRGSLQPSRTEAVGTSATLVNRYLALKDKKDDTDLQQRRRNAFVNQGTFQFAPPVVLIPDTNPLITKIVGCRRHVSTDHLLEYRVEVCPIQLVHLADTGIKGVRFDDGTTSFKPTKMEDVDPNSKMLMWIPASMMHQVHPGLVEDFSVAEEAKSQKKANKEKGRASREIQEEMGSGRRSPAPQPRDPQQTRRPATNSDVSMASDSVAPYDESELEPLGWSSQDNNGKGFIFTFPNPDISDVEEEHTASRSRPAAVDDNVVIVEDLDDEHFDRVLRNETRGHQSAHGRKRKLTAPLEDGDGSFDSLFGDISKTTSRGSRREAIMDDLFDQVMMVGRKPVRKKSLARARSSKNDVRVQAKRRRIASSVRAHPSPPSSQTVIDIDDY
ncbi:hypothetical protein EV421DRAFT_2032073 [Armillaria borealis]|uniref:XPG-I domain-containing protein n=1 Tax=Armillaria borealis TaxID=47425 RepID=A0AA39K0A1_9AGAR|nr:hypothetical protein EV421DRAFT_2032073 [Armillaria borealis]